MNRDLLQFSMGKLTADQLEKMASAAEFATAAMEAMLVMEEKGDGETALPLLHEAISRTISISNQLRGFPRTDEVLAGVHS